MKILKMKLENFQGVKELEIDPQGESSAIYGDNGTGKSTVYNAFTWLMYGKPSTTEKNYTPKTTGSHNLHHSVEMTVELADGSEMVLKKDYHEVYKTIKGICPVCGKENWICKSLAMEMGINTGVGRCLGCDTFLHITYNPERQEMDLERFEDYQNSKKARDDVDKIAGNVGYGGQDDAE